MPNVSKTSRTQNQRTGSIHPDLARDNLRGDISGSENEGPAHSEHDHSHSSKVRSRSTHQTKYRTPIR